MESDIIATFYNVNININAIVIINIILRRNFAAMNQSGDYKGLCPLCYMPVKQEDDSREITAGTRTEIYHDSCISDYVRKNTLDETNAPSIGLSLLEQYKQLIIGDSPGEREEWVESRSPLWGAQGETIKEMREHFQCSVSYVAKELGISVPRLKRFEAGKPVRDAKLLQKAFYVWVFGENLKRHYNNLHKQVHGTDYFTDLNGTNVFEDLLHADQNGSMETREVSNAIQPPRDHLASLIKEMKNYDVTHIGYTIDGEGFLKISYFYRYDLDTLNRNNAYFTALLANSTTTEATLTEIIDIYGGTFNVPTEAIRDFNNGLISDADLSKQYIMGAPNAPTTDTNRNGV